MIQQTFQKILQRGQEQAVGSHQRQAAYDNAVDVPNAAQDDAAQDDDGSAKVKYTGEDASDVGGIEGACKPGKGSTHGEGQEFCVNGVNAHLGRGQFVLADRHPRTAEAALAQAIDQEDGEQDDGDDEEIPG